jgi:hypothetical protein
VVYDIALSLTTRLPAFVRVHAPPADETLSQQCGVNGEWDWTREKVGKMFPGNGAWRPRSSTYGNLWCLPSGPLHFIAGVTDREDAIAPEMHIVLLTDLHACPGASRDAIKASLGRVAAGLGDSAARRLGIGYVWVLPESASPDYIQVLYAPCPVPRVLPRARGGGGGGGFLLTPRSTVDWMTFQSASNPSGRP